MRIINSFLVFCAIALVSTPLFGQINVNQINGQSGERINTITTAVPFLTISPNAKAGALGDAGVASDPDVNSIHWNPAKLAFVENDVAFSVSYTPWLKSLVPDINLGYLSGYKRLDDMQTIGASLLFFSLGDINFTNNQGQQTGVFSPYEFAFDVAYSRKLSENFSLGMAGRYIFSNLSGNFSNGATESKPGKTVAADVSGFYTKEIELGDKNAVLNIGGNISNIGAKMSYSSSDVKDFIPTNLRFGPGLKIEIDDYNEVSFLVDVNKLLVPTPPILEGTTIVEGEDDKTKSVPEGIFGSFTDAPGGAKEEFQELYYGTGFEYWYSGQFALRAGYFYEHPFKGNRQFFTIGAGLKYNVFGLDFSYLVTTTQANPLENTLRFSLVFDFEALSSK
jgi:hypothetical protein